MNATVEAPCLVICSGCPVAIDITNGIPDDCGRCSCGAIMHRACECGAPEPEPFQLAPGQIAF